MMSKHQNGLITQIASSVSHFVNENSRKLKTLRFLELRTSKSGLLIARGIRIMHALDKKSREAIILQHKLLSEMMQANKDTEYGRKYGFADIHTVAESDYFGLVSGHQVPDKVAKAGFTATPSPNVDAPIINEYPLTLECKVVSWADGILIGQVVNQSADERILTDGKVDLAKLQPIVFDAAGMCYRAIGDVVGGAWDAGKKFAE